MSKSFSIIKKGPTVPSSTMVNPKSFVSIKVLPTETHKFKDGNVAKMTHGKIRLRNEEEKQFTGSNSEYAEKDDIVDIKGNVIGVNENKEDHAAARVFTSLSYKPSKSTTKVK
ncbi:hypothetical protein Ocin01_10943 [Orchesella cincta]|uniref:Uncharacterized protein n=1 Tax=Orchesella cincta TaxID=48709 RepID=A0A1D2MRV4_ORCCI|nr:hypothetical protein Ocin01_10943 [Orchesella cincta]